MKVFNFFNLAFFILGVSCKVNSPTGQEGKSSKNEQIYEKKQLFDVSIQGGTLSLASQGAESLGLEIRGCTKSPKFFGDSQEVVAVEGVYTMAENSTQFSSSGNLDGCFLSLAYLVVEGEKFENSKPDQKMTTDAREFKAITQGVSSLFVSVSPSSSLLEALKDVDMIIGSCGMTFLFHQDKSVEEAVVNLGSMVISDSRGTLSPKIDPKGISAKYIISKNSSYTTCGGCATSVTGFEVNINLLCENWQKGIDLPKSCQSIEWYLLKGKGESVGLSQSDFEQFSKVQCGSTERACRKEINLDGTEKVVVKFSIFPNISTFGFNDDGSFPSIKPVLENTSEQYFRLLLVNRGLNTNTVNDDSFTIYRIKLIRK